MQSKKITATVTQRGQVTIPAEVRRILGLKPREKVVFAIENGNVRLVPQDVSWRQAFGAIRPRRKREDFEELADLAKEEFARRSQGRI